MNQTARYGSAGWTTGVPPVMTVPTAPAISAPITEESPIGTPISGMNASPAASIPNAMHPITAAPSPEASAPAQASTAAMPAVDTDPIPAAAATAPAMNHTADALPAANAGESPPGMAQRAMMIPNPLPVANECETPVMAFFDFQPWGEPYEVEMGFERGTIFPALDLPWMVEGGKIV